MHEDRDGYRRFLSETPFLFCWYCLALPSDRPGWWHAPWLIERAHVVNKPRLEDRRVVIALCSACHKTSHGERFPQHQGMRLGVDHQLWLKKFWDPDFVDLELMARCSVRLLPDAVNPWTSSEYRFARDLREAILR